MSQPQPARRKRAQRPGIDCGSDQAPERVALADGLGYNWRMAAEHFPEALQILDFCRVPEHLHAPVRLCLGEPPGATAPTE